MATEMKTDMDVMRQRLMATHQHHWTSVKSRDDFGPAGTECCSLRRKGLDYSLAGLMSSTEPKQNVFGLYIGKHDGVWVVVVKDTLTFVPVGYLEYATLDGLKTEWEMD